MSDYTYILKHAIPNKMVKSDGTVTDILGNVVTNSVTEYDIKGALPNKLLNPDGTYSTLNEILAEAMKNDLFLVVTELPEIGEENKIYLIANKDGGFDEWYCEDGNWDKIGELRVDMTQYPTFDQMNSAINSAVNDTLGGEY